MKRFSWIMGLILCVVCTVQAKDRVIERPPFLAWSSSNIEVDKIVMSDTVTTVYIKAFYRPKYWIKIASGSFLKDEKGALYPIRKGVGITLDKEFWMPESGEAEFQLLFPPIPANVTSLDFSEGDFDGAYKIWGIQLNEKDFRKSALPKGAVIHKINKKAELPVPEFAYGKATLKGQVTGYQKDMPSSGQLRLNDPIRWLNYAEEVTIKEDGSFQVQTDVITVTPATLVFPFAQIPCLLAPGKESTIIVNTAECSRQQSHLQKDNKPYGKKAYYGGYLADLQQELSDNSIPSNLVDNPSKIVKDVAGKDINGLKDYFLEKRLNTYKQIDEAPLSSAAKEILKANTDITTAIGLFMGKDIIMRAHVVSQKLNREQTKEYYTNTKIEFPVDYLDVLKDFTLNEPAEQKAVLEALPSPAYKQLLTVLNDKLLKKIELNKQKTGYKINEIGKVTNEELFSTIISKFRGHVLLVDFWATWCGPCRMANKAMIPMKEELKDEDILYLYITGETSPKGTWENMIPDIHGEHFRVTNDQWAYLMSTFKIGGVPTYFVIDAEGNTTFKQTGFPGTDTMKKQLMKALKK